MRFETKRLGNVRDLIPAMAIIGSRAVGDDPEAMKKRLEYLSYRDVFVTLAYDEDRLVGCVFFGRMEVIDHIPLEVIHEVNKHVPAKDVTLSSHIYLEREYWGAGNTKAMIQERQRAAYEYLGAKAGLVWGAKTAKLAEWGLSLPGAIRFDDVDHNGFPTGVVIY